MGCETTVEYVDRGIFLTVRGCLTSDDIDKIAYVDHLDERSVEAEFIVADYSYTTAEGLRPIDVDRVLAIDLGAAVTNPQMKLAIVATHESMVSCCERYIEKAQKLNIPWSIRLFESIDEAQTWCGA